MDAVDVGAEDGRVASGRGRRARKQQPGGHEATSESGGESGHGTEIGPEETVIDGKVRHSPKAPSGRGEARLVAPSR